MNTIGGKKHRLHLCFDLVHFDFSFRLCYNLNLVNLIRFNLVSYKIISQSATGLIQSDISKIDLKRSVTINKIFL